MHESGELCLVSSNRSTGLSVLSEPYAATHRKKIITRFSLLFHPPMPHRSVAAYRIIFCASPRDFFPPLTRCASTRIEFINYAKYILCTRKNLSHIHEIISLLLRVPFFCSVSATTTAAAASGAERQPTSKRKNCSRACYSPVIIT